MKELVILLSHYKFQIDKQKDLLEAFREIDHDADGFITQEELSKYMTGFGEPLEQKEMQYLMELAIEPESKLIDIEKLSQIMMPSDDIIEDLTQQANEKIKREEALAKAEMEEKME